MPTEFVKTPGRYKRPDGYVDLHLPHHPLANKSGRVREHRAILHDAGVLIPDGYCVHHKNGIKDDNRLENLEVLSLGDHSRKHWHSDDLNSSGGRPSKIPPATPLRDLRLARGLKLKQVEKLSGLPASLLSQLEWGLMVPQPRHLAALGSAFGVPVESWRVRFVLETEAV